MLRHAALTGSVLCVHVIPSGLVAAIDELCATAQKTEPFQAMEIQLATAGIVRVVHVTPSGLVIAVDVLCATAQKTEPFQAMELQV